MRWAALVAPPLFSYRQRSGFLFWPKRIGHEWRWLERADWVEFHARDDWWVSVNWGVLTEAQKMATVRDDP